MENKVENLKKIKFPQTRYQGSKYKLIDWLQKCLQDVEFDTCLDAFGGTASVSFLFKSMGKQVTYNDILKFNSIIGDALIANSEKVLLAEDVDFITSASSLEGYDNKIERHFKDIFYLDEENIWLDKVVQNIRSMPDQGKKSVAYWALFQSCLIKRPYNLFHRKNLSVRTKDVKRSFGNKGTWDKSFEKHYVNFVEQINRSVFCNKRINRVLNLDAGEIKQKFDLVYLDPPYIPRRGTLTNYNDFYHFLEGMVNYDSWTSEIDTSKKHKPFRAATSKWCQKDEILSEFKKLIENFKDSKIVISYRDDGIPSIEELVELLKKFGKNVKVEKLDYQYVLSKKKTKRSPYHC